VSSELCGNRLRLGYAPATSGMGWGHAIAICFFCVIITSVVTGDQPEPELVLSFSFLNFTFSSHAAETFYFQSGYYQNCMIAGIKVNPATGIIYLSIPRWKEGVPATVNL